MGLFDKLFGSGTSGSFEICPTCGAPLNEDGEDRFECSKCHQVAFRENGEIVDAFSRHAKLANNNAGTCESCQQSLAGCSTIVPWEDGNNADAYIRCPYCGHKNIKYGFGGHN